MTLGTEIENPEGDELGVMGHLPTLVDRNDPQKTEHSKVQTLSSYPK